jgi:hypothetical protein
VFEMNIAEFFQEPVPATPGSLEGEVLDLFKRLDVEDQREVLDFLLFKVKQGDQRPGRKSAEDVDEGPMLVGNDGTQRVRAE